MSKLRILTAAGSAFFSDFFLFIFPVLALCGLITCVGIPARAQVHGKNHAVHPSHTVSTNPPVSPELQVRVRALQEAKQSGDLTNIVDASRLVQALALRQIGQIQIEDGDGPKAVDSYRRSIDLEDASSAHVNLATAYLLSGQLDEAMTQATNLLLTDGSNAEAWRVQGQIWMAKKDYPHATESFQRSSKLRADGYTSYLFGLASLGAGQSVEARAIFKGLLQPPGGRVAVHLLLSDAYREAGSFDEASRELQSASLSRRASPRVHYRLGMLAMARKDWAVTPAARSEFVQEVQRNSHDFFGNYALGLAEFFAEQYAEAKLHLLAASSIHPEWPETWLYLGLIAYSHDDGTNGEPLLRKAIDLTGDDARGNYQIRRAYYTLGRWLQQQGRNSEATDCMRHLREIQTRLLMHVESGGSSAGGMAQVSATASAFSSIPDLEREELLRSRVAGGSFPFETVITLQSQKEAQSRKKSEAELGKTLSSALNDQGAVEARQEKFAMALAHFHEAEQWYPETPGLMRNLGMAAARVEDYKECVRALRPVVVADPTDALARSMLGLALFSTNSFAEAAEVFAPLGDSALDRPELAYSWAASLVKINKYTEASALLDKLETRSLSPDTMLLVAQTWSQMGNYPRTVAACHKALASDPKLLRAHYFAGLALIRQDRPAEAAQELRSELQLDPNSTDAQFHLAFVLLQQGQNEEADQWLQRVLASNPEHPEANYELGKELFTAGKAQEAIPYLEAAARLKPAFEPVHYQLQSAYRAVGRKEDADREAKTYRELKAKSRNIALPPPRETESDAKQKPNQ